MNYLIGFITFLSLLVGFLTIQTFAGKGFLELNPLNIQVLLIINLVLLSIFLSFLIFKLFRLFTEEKNSNLIGTNTKKKFFCEYKQTNSTSSIIVNITRTSAKHIKGSNSQHSAVIVKIAPHCTRSTISSQVFLCASLNSFAPLNILLSLQYFLKVYFFLPFSVNEWLASQAELIHVEEIDVLVHESFFNPSIL